MKSHLKLHHLLALALLPALLRAETAPDSLEPLPEIPAVAAPDDDGIAAAKAILAPQKSQTSQAIPAAETNAATRITAKRMEYDYQESVALFDDNVIVTDPQFKLTANRMLAFFSGTNDLKQLVIIGQVSISNDNRFARCDKAVYTRENGQIVMLGHAELERTGKGEEGKITGERITIWLNEERVEVYPAASLTLPGSTIKNGGKKGLPGGLL
ncbi:MAG: LptA/OstA family protein [Kiritimatiellia bacterium]|nr:LptA/OstA family protein [Kiritimatiellia bacterium]